MRNSREDSFKARNESKLEPITEKTKADEIVNSQAKISEGVGFKLPIDDEAKIENSFPPEEAKIEPPID